jgi:hypothetical protein
MVAHGRPLVGSGCINMLLAIKNKIDFLLLNEEVGKMLWGLTFIGYLQLLAEVIIVSIVPIGLSKLCSLIKELLE